MASNTPNTSIITTTLANTSTTTLGTPGLSGALAIWFCNGLIIQLILGRLILRFVHSRRRNRLRNHNHNPNPNRNPNGRHSTFSSSFNAFTAGDYWVLLALIIHEVRVVGDYYMNKYGTPLNVSMESLITQATKIPLTTSEQDGLILAGKFMVVSRIAIVVVLWSLKMSTLDTLSAFLPQTIQGKELCIRFMFVILTATFLASFLTIFAECKPFQLNWTLFPDVAKCSFDVKWIVSYEICNIITDTMLLFLPFLLVLGSPAPRWNKAQLPFARLIGMLVFVLGVALVAVEIVRLVEGLQLTNMLLNRIIWGSIEAVLATVVATWPNILLQLEFEQQQGPSRQGEDMEMRPLSVPSRPNEEIRHEENRAPQQAAEIDDGAQPPNETPRENTPAPKEMDQEHTRRRPATWNPTQNEVIGSILDVMLSEAKSRDSWPRRASGIRDSIRASRSISKSSLRTHGSEGNLQDVLRGWIELEDTDAGSVFQARCSPTPDIAEYNKSAEILVAREVEARSERESGQRPRLITIPKRAKLKYPAEGLSRLSVTRETMADGSQSAENVC
ncbi:hypothetical protein F5Y08DRAFT_338516 [Xylaria arbuscula]|nr:hypothetical protein F5Y08DRAFT_338516 [Xylaria arbuscula]